MSMDKEKQDDFDHKNSLVYLNSTAALMETMFKNMKNEDFVYPNKKEIGADEGRIIRSEEHIKRQRESAMQRSLLVPDIYLESVLAKMTDEDFTYGSSTTVDPNYGRVVRALELMELAGTSDNSEKVEITPKTPTPEPIQNENVCSVAAVQVTKPEPNIPAKQADGVEQPKPGRKSFGGSKKQNHRNRVKYDLQTWRNDGCSFAKDQENEMKQGQKQRRQSNDPSRQTPTNGHNNMYFVANPAFSAQNRAFDAYGTPRQPNGYGSVPPSRDGTNMFGNGGNNGFNGGNHRSMGGNNQTSYEPQMEFWNGGYNDRQQSWR